MKRFSACLKRAIFCAWFGLGVLSSAGAGEPSWLEVRSPHFSVITDAGEKRGREVATRFEQMRSVFAAMFNKAKVNLPVPLQIVAFRNTREFRQFAPLWHGKPTQLTGLFQPGQDRSFIVLDLSAEDTWKVVFHEYAHQLLNANFSHKDPWFDEGFAEYFSTIEVDSKQARVGKPSASTLLVLQQNGMMKIADLFRVRHNSATYNESGDHRTVFYAESDMLVHYIYENHLIPKVALYFDLEINRNVPVEEAIQQAFGMSATQFDKVLHGYVTGSAFKYFAFPTPPDIITTGYTVTPVSAADSNAVLADIHLHSPGYTDKAIQEFQDILKDDPNSAAACRGLGYAYLRKKQYEEAGPYFQRAAQLDSKDPRVHYYAALLLSRQGSFSNRDQLPQTIKELETAIALDPAFADPYMLLGFAWSYNGDRAKGLEVMQKAIALDPGNEGYQFNLAQMYMLNQKFDECIRLLHGLEKTQNPGQAIRVQQLLANVQRLQEMAKRGPVVIRTGEASNEPDAENADADKDSDSTEETEDTEKLPPTHVAPIKFIQGTITAVDCSSPPSASLTVVSGDKTWKMKVPDRDHTLLFGADKFSCSWNKQQVMINYRETADAQGNVVSIEMQ